MSTVGNSSSPRDMLNIWRCQAVDRLVLDMQKKLHTRNSKFTLICNQSINRFISNDIPVLFQKVAHQSIYKPFSVSPALQEQAFAAMRLKIHEYSGIRISKFRKKPLPESEAKYFEYSNGWYNGKKAQWYAEYYFQPLFAEIKKYCRLFSECFLQMVMGSDYGSTSAHLIDEWENCMRTLMATTIQYKGAPGFPLIFSSSYAYLENMTYDILELAQMYNIPVLWSVERNMKNKMYAIQIRKTVDQIYNRKLHELHEKMFDCRRNVMNNYNFQSNAMDGCSNSCNCNGQQQQLNNYSNIITNNCELFSVPFSDLEWKNVCDRGTMFSDDIHSFLPNFGGNNISLAENIVQRNSNNNCSNLPSIQTVDTFMQQSTTTPAVFSGINSPISSNEVVLPSMFVDSSVSTLMMNDNRNMNVEHHHPLNQQISNNNYFALNSNGMMIDGETFIPDNASVFEGISSLPPMLQNCQQCMFGNQMNGKQNEEISQLQWQMQNMAQKYSTMQQRLSFLEKQQQQQPQYLPANHQFQQSFNIPSFFLN